MRLMMRIALAACWVLIVGAVARGDFAQEAGKAMEEIRPVMKEAEALMREGLWEEANQKIMSGFPQKGRSGAQALVLGNVLYKQNPKMAYALHQEAARSAPEEANVQLEWGMEQHRAGEYAGAAEAYERFCKIRPGYAPAYGLLAECLIRQGKLKEAVKAWNDSEKAPRGTLENLESLVCEVHWKETPDRERAELIQRVKKGDIDSAEALVVLDRYFPMDWWNSPARKSYQGRDLELIKGTTFKDVQRKAEVVCAAEAAIASAEGRDDVGQILKNGKLLLDPAGTMPQSAKLFSFVLSLATEGELISKEQARQKWGEKILTRAKKTKDVDAYNAAAYLYVETDQLTEIDDLGWAATGQPRFARSRVVGLLEEGKLTLAKPILQKAARQFPEDAEIVRVVVAVTEKENRPLTEALVQGIKAEYSKFSMNGLVGRPKASMLRRYFQMLGKELGVN